MDQERFDELTRTLASGQSRRGLLKGLTGTAIGGLLAAVGLSETSAKPEVPCKSPNHRCGKGKNAVCCTSSQVCDNGACITPPQDLCLGKDCDDNNECTTDYCSEGVCFHRLNTGGLCSSPDGSVGTGRCNSMGGCDPIICTLEFQPCDPNADTCCNQCMQHDDCISGIPGDFCC